MSRFIELMLRGQPDLNPPRPLVVKRDLVRIPPARRNPDRPEVTTTFHRQSETARLLAKLKKQWKLSALFAAAVFFSTVVATYLTKPIYQPTASLEIDPPGAELYNTQNAESSGASEEYLGTEVKNLQSDELAIAVIRQLRLDQNADMIPPRGRPPVDTVVSPPSALRLAPAEYAALDTFRRRIKVERDATSRIVSVSFASHDPVLAATVTNSLLTTFIEMTYERRRASIVQLSAWLEKQLEDVKANLDRSTKALAEFQQATGIADVDGTKNTVSEQMAELGRQETQAESERIQLESLLENATQPEALAEVHNSPVVQDLSSKLAENQAELQKAQVIYGENHPEVRKLQNEARELKNQLAVQTDSVVERLQTSRAAAESRKQAISKEMKVAAGQLSQVARYNALKKDVETNTTLCNDLYRRIKEAGISAGARSTDMEIVDQARVLDHPTRPNWVLNLAGGLFAGILGGILIGSFRESLDTRIHEPEDLRGLPAATGFTFIPVLGSNLGLRERTQVRKEPGPQLYLQERPHSPEAEAVRALKTSILFACAESNYRILLVTSSLPHEGKSTLAINLATALSQHGKTCLVEADLRKPSLAHIFNLHSAAGLSNVLSGSGTLTPHEVSPNLMVVPAGKVAGDVSPDELLSPQAMTPLIEELRSKFQFVILDSSPLLSFAEGRVLARLADGIVFVCRYGVTTKEALSRSEEILKAGNGAPILEIVVNGSRTGLQDYFYYLNPS